jgi:hypothetical protein
MLWYHLPQTQLGQTSCSLDTNLSPRSTEQSQLHQSLTQHNSQKRRCRHRRQSPKLRIQQPSSRRHHRRRRRRTSRGALLVPPKDRPHNPELIRDLLLLEGPDSARQRGIPIRPGEESLRGAVYRHGGRDGVVCRSLEKRLDFRSHGGL